jgi:hypothetical protein
VRGAVGTVGYMSNQRDLVDRLRNAADPDALIHVDPLLAMVTMAADEMARLRELTSTQLAALQALAEYAYVGASRMGGGPQADIPEHTGDESTCGRCRALSVFDRLNTGDLAHLLR